MNELDYVECLVKRKASATYNILKILFGILTVISLLGFLIGGPFFGSFAIIGMIICFILMIVFGFLCYYCNLNSNIEYEYQYCEKEITVDKVLNKSRRKRVGKFETERMEIFAPINSYHLDEFKNKKYQELDFSEGVVNGEDTRYVLYYDGRQKLIMNPSEKLVSAVYLVAPRKTFKD